MRLVLKALVVWLAWMAMTVPVVLLAARVFKAHQAPPGRRESREDKVYREWLDLLDRKAPPAQPVLEDRRDREVYPDRREM